MKIYVVTDGDYSDYHICGVAVTKEMAEKITEHIMRIDSYSCPNIEEYDTNTWIETLNNGNMFHVVLLEDGRMNLYDETYDMEYGYENRNKVFDFDKRGALNVWVFAKDEDHAKKIASDLFAKYMAEKEGL